MEVDVDPNICALSLAGSALESTPNQADRKKRSGFSRPNSQPTFRAPVKVPLCSLWGRKQHAPTHQTRVKLAKSAGRTHLARTRDADVYAPNPRVWVLILVCFKIGEFPCGFPLSQSLNMAPLRKVAHVGSGFQRVCGLSSRITIKPYQCRPESKSFLMQMLPVPQRWQSTIVTMYSCSTLFAASGVPGLISRSHPPCI